MKADPRFQRLPKAFWANIRSLSQHIGYTERGTRQIRVPNLPTLQKALREMGLRDHHIVQSNETTTLGRALLDYFTYRAHALNSVVEPLLMDALEAKEVFQKVAQRQQFTCAIPMNKQKGDKKAPAYFTGIINMLIQENCGTESCDFSPRELTTITREGAPLRTLARWVDGAFPSAINPIAIWEIKEYYYTTTFGSRVADGVYETLLDGMELEELREHEGVDVLHYLMVDSHNTWWKDGKSYLCRLIDMLHMGYVDELLFGKEVLSRLPELVRTWRAIAKNTNMHPASD